MKLTALAAFSIMLTFSNRVTSQSCTYNGTETEVGFFDCGEAAEDVRGIAFYEGNLPEIKKGLFAPYPKLRKIYIEGVNTQKIEPGAFDGLQLTSISLSLNSIKNIEHGTFNSLNITENLQLSNNQLESIGANIFLGLTSLSELTLGANKIKTVDKAAFNGLENLKSLYLSWNKIESLELGTFDSLVSLQLLHLSDNPLTEIKFGLFARLEYLEDLYLSENNFESLPDYVFSNLTAIQAIDLSENKLSELQENLFYGMESLEILNFHSNNVRRFDSKRILARLPWLEKVILYGNPWKCDELRKIRKDFQAKNVIGPISSSVTNSSNVEGIACSE